MPDSSLPSVVRINQRHWTGCAIAAIASVVGVSYEKVEARARWLGLIKRRPKSIDLFDFGSRSIDYSIYFKDFLKVIRSFGVKAVRRQGFDFSNHRAILVCKNDVASYHCVVWDPAFGGRFVDPAWLEPDPRRTYISQWRRAGKETFIITGRR